MATLETRFSVMGSDTESGVHIASLSGEVSVGVRRWLNQVMEPVERVGMNADEIYKQFLVECARNESSSVVAAAVQPPKTSRRINPAARRRKVANASSAVTRTLPPM